MPNTKTSWSSLWWNNWLSHATRRETCIQCTITKWIINVNNWNKPLNLNNDVQAYSSYNISPEIWTRAFHALFCCISSHDVEQSRVSMNFTISTKKYSMYIDGLVEERRNSIANALELRLSCTSPYSHVWNGGLFTCMWIHSYSHRHHKVWAIVVVVDVCKLVPERNPVINACDDI